MSRKAKFRGATLITSEGSVTKIWMWINNDISTNGSARKREKNVTAQKI